MSTSPAIPRVLALTKAEAIRKESMTELAARHAADPTLTELTVAYYLSDGTTARASYPYSNTDPAEAVEALIRDKKRQSKGLAVDSLDSETGAGAERFIAPSHIVAWVIERGRVAAHFGGWA